MLKPFIAFNAFSYKCIGVFLTCRRASDSSFSYKDIRYLLGLLPFNISFAPKLNKQHEK